MYSIFETMKRYEIDLIEHIALRNDLMLNIQLADNKALGLMMAYPTSEMKELYIEVINPNLDTTIEIDNCGEEPKDYEIFNAKTPDHIKHQCKILRQILLKKYRKINKMIEIAKRGVELEKGC